MGRFPKFFICENLSLPDSIFVIHITYPKFMVELTDEKIIWLEEESNNFQKILHKDIITEAIDWALAETSKLNEIRNNAVTEIQNKTKFEFIQKFN